MEASGKNIGNEQQEAFTHRVTGFELTTQSLLGV
jgi:hypothetical protein